MKTRLLITITALCFCFLAVSVAGSPTWLLRLPTGPSGEVRIVTGYRWSAGSLNNGRRGDRNCSGKSTT